MKRKKSADSDLVASLNKIGWLRLSMAAAHALGQQPVDAAYFDGPERDLLSVNLQWNRVKRRLTLRGGEGPFKVRVYRRGRLRENGTRTTGARPLFMIIIPSRFFRAAKGLWVPSTHRFTLERVAEKTLVLDRELGVKVANQRRRGPKGPYRVRRRRQPV